MASRNLTDLTQQLADKARVFLSMCRENGLPVHITCTGRTIQEQQALYAQGREDLASVNEKRKACGLWAISDKENKRPVTWTMDSLHVVQFDELTGMLTRPARAFDVAIVRDKQFIWELKADVNENDIPDWEEIGAIGESCGLVWGGRWATPDRPHFQDTD